MDITKRLLMSKIFPILLISWVGIVVYSNTYHCPFELDDIPNIVENNSLKNFHNILGVWDFYPCRFLFYLSIAFNYHLHQFNMVGYHVFNVGIHLGVAVLVWWFVLLTLSSDAMKEEEISKHADLVALFAGLIFVAHPIQTEAVTYIDQRAACMAALFYMASICFYIKSRFLAGEQAFTFRRRVFYICSFVTAVAAMFTKENTITLPLMILLYEFIFLKKDGKMNWAYLIPILCSIAIIPLTKFMTRAGDFQLLYHAAQSPSKISPVQYLLTQLRVMVTYIRLVFLPINQNLDYDYPISRSIFELPTLISFVFLSGILFSAKQLYANHKLMAFSIFWFFLSLLPESTFLPIQDVIFEHRLYLPMVGGSIFLLSGLYYLCGRHDLSLMVKVLTVLIICYALLTYQRNQVWGSEFSLWDDAAKKSPYKTRPYDNRGVAYGQQGHLTQAIADFNQAIEINPHDAKAFCNRGRAYELLGNFAQAISDYSMTIALMPDFALAYRNRAIVYYHIKEYDKAFADMNKAKELNEASLVHPWSNNIR
jgi:hypothetical protein